jgi:3-oxoacyl-[acyl-carrier protein] reductase
MNEARRLDLSGRCALVSGGGAGIGLAIACAFASLGARVVVAERDAARAADAERVLSPLSSGSWAAVTDVTSADAVRELGADIERRCGALDLLVNNVGDFLNVLKPFERTTEEEWDALYAVNLRHLFLVTRAMLPLLRRSTRGASVINVSTIEAFRGIPMACVYAAFKAGVTGFTKSLALELAPARIRVNAIAPETTETEQVKPSLYIQPQYRDHVRRWIPLGRFGAPEDVAGAAVFLASELSAWMTGTTLHVDGGALAAGGWYRTPDEHWTNVPVVSDNGLKF